MVRVPLVGLKRAVEDRQVLVLDGGRAFDGAGGVDVADDGVGLVGGVAELEQRGGHGVVHDLDHAAADQLLVLHQRQVGLDAGGVAVHHEADGAGGRQHRDLRVAVAELLAVLQGLVPGLLAGLVAAPQERWSVLMLFTEARCMRMTSRNGSRLMYQPGHAAPRLERPFIASLVERPFRVASRPSPELSC